MGYSGPGKISGHSGTEHKHRKAFEKIKSYNSSTSPKSGDFILPIVSSVPTDYQQAYHQDRKIRLYFKLPVFIITIIVIGFVFVESSTHYKMAFKARNNKEITDYNSEQATKKIEAYNILVNSGYRYLRRNQLYGAQKEFVQALSIDEYGKNARIGLSVTMLKRCQQYHEACEDVQGNLDFLHSMKYLPENKIIELETELDIVYLE